MKRIPLTQGQFALVDDADFDRLNQHKWCASWNPTSHSFYAKRQSSRKDNPRHLLQMAREILGLKYGDKRQADHIDHNTLDNRASNLRIVTIQQNQWNQKNPRGYSWNKFRGKYTAQISVNDIKIHLGCFGTAKEAHAAYLKGKERHHKIKVAS